jgi:hypothetical protein
VKEIEAKARDDGLVMPEPVLREESKLLSTNSVFKVRGNGAVFDVDYAGGAQRRCTYMPTTPALNLATLSRLWSTFPRGSGRSIGKWSIRRTATASASTPSIGEQPRRRGRLCSSFETRSIT